MRIGYGIIKLWLRFGLFLYFTKIRVLGREHIPIGKPIMLLANHQNALMDAMLIAVKSGLRPYFLARSDLFKNSVLSHFLNFLQMMPIYRIRDGIETLKNNPEIFGKCGRLLAKGETLMLFPEGNHGIQRRVRTPMRKGFIKMIFNALEKNPELDIRILPVGLNYIKAEDFPDSAAMYIGKGIEVQKLYDPTDLEGSTKRLKEEVYKSLVKLTTHIPDDVNYGNIQSQLDDKGVDYLDPAAVNRLISKMDTQNEPFPRTYKKRFWGRGVQLLFYLLNLPIILVWNKGIKPLGKEIEFRSTLRFLTGLIFLPIYYAGMYILIHTVYGQKVALLCLAVLFAFNFAYVKFR